MRSLPRLRFQSTLPQEERLVRYHVTLTHPCISIHAPTRGATLLVKPAKDVSLDFNPRSHKRSDRVGRYACGDRHDISIHAPTRGATLLQSPFNLAQRFQSTLPQEERLDEITYGSTIPVISIHAPTRGATHPGIPVIHLNCISIHAPTRGATMNLVCDDAEKTFQSTLPQEERLACSPSCSSQCPFQSTLPQEERHQLITVRTCRIYFNPRSHKRSDQTNTSSLGSKLAFQSTLPQEERLTTPAKRVQYRSFQSTLPQEERHGRLIIPYKDVISIHAPTRGATP